MSLDRALFRLCHLSTLFRLGLSVEKIIVHTGESGKAEYQLIGEQRTPAQAVTKHRVFSLHLKEEDVKALESSPTHIPHPFVHSKPGRYNTSPDAKILYV